MGPTSPGLPTGPMMPGSPLMPLGPAWPRLPRVPLIPCNDTVRISQTVKIYDNKYKLIFFISSLSTQDSFVMTIMIKCKLIFS